EPEYADPVIREPSPASSVGTVYGPDQTASSELDQPTFERKWEDRLTYAVPPGMRNSPTQTLYFPVRRPPWKSVASLFIFKSGPAELRAKVDELEENELFEQTMLRGSQASLEEETIPKDIDSLMLSMMGPSSVGDTSGNATVTDGPWMQSGNRYEAGAAQARTKGKGKSRK
ncbi:hypothetical protein B0H13DRAFT_1611156, partial [Mycena leptocephala]